ncbi:hypothetical protein OG21DRAFT_938508 [Imleria badia]|nr:hypothetical protein OG21DRAFT_938508 [Imleria badia]
MTSLSWFPSMCRVLHSSTLLLLDDLEGIGCHVLRSETSRMDSPLVPCPLNTGTSRTRLPAWLSRLLLCILWPEKPQQRPNLVRNSKSGHSLACWYHFASLVKAIVRTCRQ